MSNEIIKLDANKIKHSVPIENNRKVLGYICGDINRSIRLSSKLKNEFTQIFGVHNKTFRGEFLNYIWIVSFKDETFEIFTSNRGTTYEIVCSYEDVQKKEEVCIEFLKEIKRLFFIKK